MKCLKAQIMTGAKLPTVKYDDCISYISSSLYYVNLFFLHNKFAKYEMDNPTPSTDIFITLKQKY